MPIKLYDSRDAVPEAARANAIETKDGKFAVEEAADPSLGDPGRKALEEERKAKKAAEDRAKAAEKERDELKRASEAKGAGITDEQLNKLRDEDKAARKPIEDELEKTKAELRKTKRDDRLEALLAKAGVLPARMRHAMKDLADRVDLTADGDGFVVKDVNGKIVTESIDDFVTTSYKKEAPFLYRGPDGSGSGAEAGGGGGDGTASTYDPVKAGKEAAAKQKQGVQENKLAFT